MKKICSLLIGFKRLFLLAGSSGSLGPVSFSLKKGECVGVVGRSGFGKSTFLHLAGGILRPDSGEISFCEENINTLSDAKLSRFRNKHMGFVFQDFYLIDEFSLLENVALPLILRRMTRKQAFTKAEVLLSQIGLTGKEQNLPH